MGGLRRARRIHRSRSGRVPYSLVAIVILASVLALSLDLSAVETLQGTYLSFDTPENTQAALSQVEGEIVQAAHFDLLNATAQVLAQSSFANGVGAPLNLLNVTTNQYFHGSLMNLSLVAPAGGQVIGTTNVRVLHWGINVTYAEGTVVDPTNAITSTPVDATSVGMGTLSIPNPTYPDALATTQENLYPMAIGTVSLLAADGYANSTETTSYSFSTTLQSEIGLLESKSAQFSDDAFGAGGGFARLVAYLATTLAQVRALAGYGSGGYPGPHATSTVAQPGTPSILTTSDVDNATSFAILLESLRYFRSFDPNAVTSFTSSLPPGAVQTLIDRYIANGTVDGASLFVLLMNSPSLPYGIGNISSGEDTAQAIYSFADRFVYDILWQFWNNQTMDPTLTNPVADWNLLLAQHEPYAEARVVQWLTDYKNWLGVTVAGIPRVEGDATIPALTGNFGGCTYYLFPGGDVEVSAPQISGLESLIMGLVQEVDITLANSTGFGNGVYHYYYAPGIYPIYDNLSIADPYGGHSFCEWAFSAPDGQFCGIGSPEEQGYYVTDRSLLWEYNKACSPWANGCANWPPAPGTPTYFNTLRELVLNTTASIANKSATPTVLTQKGYLDYVAFQGMKDGNNYTGAQVGFPSLATTAGIGYSLNSSYSYLTNGSDAILRGPLTTAANKFSTQATNNTTVDQWWIYGAAHPDLQPAADTPGPNAGIAWTMTDIARATSRLSFQELYGLWYGSQGTIPNAPWFPLTYQAMDSANYNIVSTGIHHVPPLPGREPDFFMMTQNETYIEMLCWMDEYFSDCQNDGEIAGENGFGDTAAAPQPAYGQGFCGFGNLGAAYADAMNNWWDPGNRGTPTAWATWQLVARVVTQAMDGVVNGPNSLGGGIAGGFATVHQQLTSSWWSVKNDTGNAYWACGYTAATCPAYDSGNFTRWILAHIAPPIINDTNALGRMNGWLHQILNSTDTWLNTGANTTGTIYRPTFAGQSPYQFWYGNRTTASENAAIFQEALSGMEMRTSAGTLSWQAPRTTVHLVDPQDVNSNMGIAPYTTTWEIAVHGTTDVQLNATRGSLGADGALLPSQLNVTIPLNFVANATIYTPWELGSGWDPNPSPLPGDPVPVETRGLLGLTGHDYGNAPNFLPGIYLSPTLDSAILTSSVAARISDSNGLLLAGLFAGLPDRVVGGSGAWAENLSLLETTTNSDLAATTGYYLTSVSNDMTTMANLVNARYRGTAPDPLTAHDGASNGYFGQNFELDLAGKCLAYYDSYVNPGTCGDSTSFPAYAPESAYNLGFSGTRVSTGMAVDDQYNGPAPTLNVHGFRGTWDGTSAGNYALNGTWQEFTQPYTLVLTGPAAAPALASSVSDYAALAEPYYGPLSSSPAVLSAWGDGGLPPALASAFQRSVGTWLPSPGVFENYVSEQLYQAGYLYDSLAVTNPTYQPGVTSFGWSTLLNLTASHGQNYSVYVQDPNGLYGNASQLSNAISFLAWYELNHRALAYDLGAPSADPTVLSTATAYVLANAYRNVSFVESSATSVTLLSWAAANMAFTEADLGGASGGLYNVPTVEIGGTAPATAWGYSGTLSEA